MKNIGGITKYLFIFMIAMTLAQSAQGGDWTMFMRDLMHSGTSDEVVQPPLELLWNYSTTGSIETSTVISSSPVISKNVLYIGDNGGIHAIDATSGSLKWMYQIGEVHSAPAVSDGSVFAGSNDHIVYALDAATGKLKWKYTTDGGVSSSPAVSAGVVYVGSFYPGKSLYALDAATGTLKWKYETKESIWSSPAVSGGVVYIGSDDNNVYALDVATGAVKWKYNATNFIESSPAVSGGMVYVGSGDKNVYALDATTGNLKWKYKTEGYVHSSPAVSGGVVYVGSDDYSIYALDAATGVLKWSYKTGGVISSSPAVSDGVVYIGSKDKNIYALDAEKGTLKWKYATGNSILSSPAISGGRVYAASTDRIYAFGSESAKLADLRLSMNVPPSKYNGTTMNYTLRYNNFGKWGASNVLLQDTLSQNVDFVFASDNGVYNRNERKVMWNIGSVGPSSSGTRTVTVRIRDEVKEGTAIHNIASINATTLESNYDDNIQNAKTASISRPQRIPPSFDMPETLADGPGDQTIWHWNQPLPLPYPKIEPIVGLPPCTVTWAHIIATFPEVLPPDNFLEHNLSQGPDGRWSYIFPPPINHLDSIGNPKPLHGTVTIFITTNCDPGGFAQPGNFYVDPAGYIYDVDTFLRIRGATVLLMKFNTINESWEISPEGKGLFIPDLNPQTTNVSGQYQWDVKPGTYKVHVEASGYYPEDSRWVDVPPIVTDLHVGLKRIPVFNISGFKINDDNGKGIQGWKISLKNDITGVEIATTQTDVNGFYEFMNLSNGTYNLTEDLRPNYTPTGATYRTIRVEGKDVTDQTFRNKLSAIDMLSSILIILGGAFLFKKKEKS